jgi:hypothetical protein
MVAATRAAMAVSPGRSGASQACLLDDGPETREGLLVDVLLRQAQHGEFAAASGQGFDHCLALPNAQVEPVGADERQPFTVRGVGIDADHGDA